jgi:hypothetical protein
MADDATRSCRRMERERIGGATKNELRVRPFHLPREQVLLQ